MVFRTFLLVSVALGAPSLHAKDYLVSSQKEYFEASKKVKAGDAIILADRTWRDFEITLTGEGTKKRPITLRAQTAGKVIISGQSNLRIGGKYIQVKGLVFRDGYSPTGEVVSFRRAKGRPAYNSRITEVVIDHFSKPDRYDNDYWVGMYGKNNRFDHNHMAGKTNKGVTMAVRLDSPESQENNHRIDHNYFGPRPVLGSNGGETLRIGTSKYSAFDSGTLVENNYFDRTDGEVEIISSKSGRNIFRGNVFFESIGTLTLRHGNDAVVERNVFFGNGKRHSGGIRVINANQTVWGNYMEGLQGAGFASALTVMNGVPNSPVNRYVQVSGAVISNNSILNSKFVTLAGGADAERSAPPIDSKMTDNLLTGGKDGPVFRIQDDISGVDFANNALINAAPSNHPAGIAKADITLTRAKNGLLYPDNAKYASVGAPADLKPITREQVGVSWYAKPVSGQTFGTGSVVTVPAQEGALSKAYKAAAGGDILELVAGEHTVSKTLLLDKAVTIRGKPGSDGKPAATILFDRPFLFEMAEGGSLRLAQVNIDGKIAPDSVGNAMIRTTSFPMQSNFQIEMDGIRVQNLSVNKAFDVIRIGKNAFADRVMVRNSKFSDISGSLLHAAAETEDYGQYNVEYVDIEGSKFKNLGGPLVNLYRGGRDESTFGPHFTLVKSKLKNVGLSKNNASGVSLLLHGVQHSDVSENRISASAPILVKHTVGRPQTRITKNRFSGTPEIQVEELNYKGDKQRAVLTDNEFSEAAVK